MISIIHCTARKQGSFDRLANSLARGSRTGFELIVVDALRTRADEFADCVKGRFPWRYVVPKPSAWQGPYRKTQADYFDLNNARNTGIALARGTYIVLVDDCTEVGSSWLDYHYRAAKKNVALAGGYTILRCWNDQFAAYMKNGYMQNDTAIQKDHRDTGRQTKRITGAWFWGLNCSFPLEYALKVNGFDEQYSGQGGSDDVDFGVRIERAGCEILYSSACQITQVLETHGHACGHAGWGQDPLRKEKEKMLKDDKLHFANELLIERLLNDPKVFRSSSWNDFDLSDLRTKALKTGNFPTNREVTHDWRDEQPLEDMK